MWRDPLEELVLALEKVVDVPVPSNPELSVEYLERSYAQWQIEIDAILFGTKPVMPLNENGANDSSGPSRID